MTNEMMSLRALLEKSSDTDVLREMIGFAAHRLMDLEVESLTGAAHGERSADRITQRNGYRERDLPPSPRNPKRASRVSWSRAGWPRRRWRQ
jgi:transposase-like protein